MAEQNAIKPELPGGQIVELKTMEDCVKYLGESSLEDINCNLKGSQRLEDYLPFRIELLETDVVTISTDEVYSGIPKKIVCDTLAFDCGSITSYVQLQIDAKETQLINPSPNKEYQILVSGTKGNDGSEGLIGDSGSAGADGQSQTNEEAGSGGPGGAGNPGKQGGAGTDGGGTPLSILGLGTITLSGSDLFTINAEGGSGGKGGNGGKGGTGGKGGDGGSATSTSCSGYNGGSGGTGGQGGTGGKGGKGGSGSRENSDMTIKVASNDDKSNLATHQITGKGELGGTSEGGDGGAGGTGGTGSACGGENGSDGMDGAKGDDGGTGVTGSEGSKPDITVTVG